MERSKNNGKQVREKQDTAKNKGKQVREKQDTANVKNKKIALVPTTDPSPQDEMFFKILNWLTVQSCKSACKQCNAMIQDTMILDAEQVRGEQDTANDKNKKIDLVPTSTKDLLDEIIYEIVSWLTVQSLLKCKCVCKKWYAIIREPKQLRGKQDSANDKNKKFALVPTTDPYLPHEIIFEILSRLRVPSLLRCKCVCKQWYAIIQDPKFIQEQMTRTTRAYFYTCKGETPNIEGVEETFEFLHSCDGLLLEKSSSSLKCRIRNPATRQILDLPEPQKQVECMLISFDRSTCNYKLVNIYGNERVTGNGGCEVLTLGNGVLSWRPLNITNLHDLKKKRETIKVFLDHGIIYCFRFVEIGSGDSEVVCINLENEDFTSGNVPQQFFRDWNKVWPISWNGKMSLAGVEGEELTVWVLEDHKKHKWAEGKIVIPLTFMQENPHMKEGFSPYPVAESDKLWFYVNRVKMFVYYIESQKVECVASAPEGKTILCINNPSLVALKGMQPVLGMQPERKQTRNELGTEQRRTRCWADIFLFSSSFLLLSLIYFS